VGRWAKGKAAESRLANTSVRHGRWTLVSAGKKGWELYDLQEDPGESKDVAAEHPEQAAKMAAAHEAWWKEILPCLENEDAPVPAVNPFKDAYWAQFGGGPRK
jgi:arylsulfatase A-like enzyme